MKNFGWVLLGIGLVVLWLFFPTIFSWWAEYAWHVPTAQLAKKSDLGPLGDIYGSLNTLISSIALCAVAFSTWLQVTSLKETRKATTLQLKEVRDSALADQFYSLMTFKNEMLYQMRFKAKNSFSEAQKSKDWDREVNAVQALGLIARRFKSELSKKEIVNFNYKRRLSHFEKIIEDIFEGEGELSPLISYFYIYGNLIKLINNSNVDDAIKENFRSVLSNTMLQEEQITLFWMASVFEELNNMLENSELFNKFHYEIYNEFALMHHKISHFKSEKWKKLFKENQTST